MCIETKVEKDDTICISLNELDFDEGRIPRSSFPLASFELDAGR